MPEKWIRDHKKSKAVCKVRGLSQRVCTTNDAQVLDSLREVRIYTFTWKGDTC